MDTSDFSIPVFLWQVHTDGEEKKIEKNEPQLTLFLI